LLLACLLVLSVLVFAGGCLLVVLWCMLVPWLLAVCVCVSACLLALLVSLSQFILPDWYQVKVVGGWL